MIITAYKPTKCHNQLTVLSSGGNLQPKKEYIYNSVKLTLERFFSRPHFTSAIENWRSRTTIKDSLFDVFDGNYWSNFKKDGLPFVLQPGSLMLSLNVDWFSPTKTMNYSVGAIYLIVNNLPRAERFRRENLILVGIMPGPKEPELDSINHFLKPMVDELLVLFEGMILSDGRSVRAALMSVNCDLPAVKKVCGFTAFNSFIPCHKCSDRYLGQSGRPQARDLSNLDDLTWNRRDGQSNRQQALKWKEALTTGDRKRLEQMYGTRYSELHRLEYFDLIRCTTVDALHNLYLGTAKRMMDWWKKTVNPVTRQVYLSDADFRVMAARAKNIAVPPQFTPIAHKIASGFVGMKGDEWRSWVFVYSGLLLKGKITGDALTSWMKFVKANQILGGPSITNAQIDEAHKFLKEFGQECSVIYGANIISPNFHLHLHLKETIRDFGPIYSTWLYGMERANGDIKDVNTNFKQGLEATFMKKYLQHVHAQDYIKGFSARIFNNPIMMNVLSSLLPGIADSLDNDEDSLGTDLSSNTQRFDLATFISHSTDDARLITGSEPLPPSFFSHKHFDRSVVMNSMHHQGLLDFYKDVYYRLNYDVVQYRLPHHRIRSTLIASMKIKKFTEINLLGQQIRSVSSRTKRGIYIEALVNGEFRVGRVAYFFSHVVEMPVYQRSQTQDVTHVFAFVEWFKKSPYYFESFNAHSAFVWQSAFETIDKHSILPVHRIHTCVATEPYVENSMISVSLPRKIVNTF
jgi:hypothetical protein